MQNLLLIGSLSLLISFFLSLFFFLDVFHQRFFNFISTKNQLSFIDLFTCFSVSISIISSPSLLFFFYELQVLFALFILIPLGIRVVCLSATALFVFFRQACIPIHLPVRASFVLPHRVWRIVFSFSVVLRLFFKFYL